MATIDLTAARLRELLHYEPTTGVFTWRISRGSRRAGQQTGAINSQGYIYIGVDGRIHKRAHLAWLYVTGTLPPRIIDHIDGDRSNDRITNLRDADARMNAQNLQIARRKNKSGLLGVSMTIRKGVMRWEAHIGVSGKRRYIGIFSSPEAAHAVYLEAKRKLHDGCTI